MKVGEKLYKDGGGGDVDVLLKVWFYTTLWIAASESRAMDPPLEPPLRARFDTQPQDVSLQAAHHDLQRFIDEARNGRRADDDDEASFGSSSQARGTSAVVLGQLQRLSDSLAREQRAG